MHRIDGAGNDENQFTEGNPSTGTPATVVTDDWLNAVQEEISHVIEGAGTALDKEDNTQLLAAIQALILAGTPTIEGDRVFITGVTAFAVGVQNNDAVYWDSANSKFDQAIADGTEKQNMVGFADVTGGEVTLYGNLDTLSGLTPGRYYLSGDTAGAITQTIPSNPVMVGMAKPATTLFVDIDSAVDVMTPHLAEPDPHPQYLLDTLYGSVALISDHKESGTVGGDALVGWQDRDLNTIDYDPKGIVVDLTGGDFQLNDGVYLVEASSPGTKNTRRCALYCIDDASYLEYGDTARCAAGSNYAENLSRLSYVLTVSGGPKTYRIRDYCHEKGAASTGLGSPGYLAGVDEIYTKVKLRRLA